MDTARQNFFNRIVRAMDKRYAVGMFLDIEGAFDNTSYNSMCKVVNTEWTHLWNELETYLLEKRWIIGELRYINVLMKAEHEYSKE